MRQRKYLVLATLLAGLAACSKDAPDTTGPSPAPGSQAVAAATVTYSIKNIGTLGGNISVANDINNVGQTVGWARTAGDKTHAFLHPRRRHEKPRHPFRWRERGLRHQ